MLPKNSALADALSRAGIKGTKSFSELEEEEAHARKTEEIIRENERLKKIEEERASYRELLERTSAFEKLWSESKSRNFVIHLLYAILPFEKIHYLWDWPKGVVQRSCSFCHQELMTKTEAFEKSSELAEASISNIARELRGEITNAALESYRTVFGNKVWATGAEETNTLFCPACMKNFSDWIELKLMEESDQQFSSIIRKIRIKHVENRKR